MIKLIVPLGIRTPREAVLIKTPALLVLIWGASANPDAACNANAYPAVKFAKDADAAEIVADVVLAAVTL